MVLYVFVCFFFIFFRLHLLRPGGGTGVQLPWALPFYLVVCFVTGCFFFFFFYWWGTRFSPSLFGPCEVVTMLLLHD